ncbi:hypothetical protein H2248_008649 [Termitomyces sp. 'cryptogamus']|nr:hypothetical protein H2248_008649 [Termitomyces sp. 'cryptogamus']
MPEPRSARVQGTVLLQRWPWNCQQNLDRQNPEVSEAAKFGFRALSKPNWDKLKDVPVSHRERSVAKINAFQDATERLALTPTVPNPQDNGDSRQKISSSSVAFHPSSLYTIFTQIPIKQHYESFSNVVRIITRLKRSEQRPV